MLEGVPQDTATVAEEILKPVSFLKTSEPWDYPEDFQSEPAVPHPVRARCPHVKRLMGTKLVFAATCLSVFLPFFLLGGGGG